MNTVRRFAILVIALALLCSSIPAVYAQDEPSAGHIVYMPAINATTSSQGGDTGQVVTKIISPAEQQAALNFWTRDAIAKAQPLAMPMQMGAPTVDEMATSAVLGPPGFSSPGLADPEAMKVLQAAYPEDWAALNKEEALIGPEAVEGTSQIYTSYIVNYLSTMQKIYPHIWVGRLSFKTSGGTSYCSGTSISNNIMLTAAHCVYDSTNNVWYSNWVLTPAYRNGNAPYGTFPATQCYVLGAYQSLTGSYAINTWARHDVAVCKMGKNSAGTTLNSAVGWMGRQWNYAYARHFHDLGYPFNNYNNVALTNAGKYLRTCAAESFQQATETRGMGCNWGPGISGGPWMIKYAPGVLQGWADGVNSGLFIGTQNLYGPRFNSNNIVPLCTAAGC